MTDGRRTEDGLLSCEETWASGAERHWDDSQGARVAEGDDGAGN